MLMLDGMQLIDESFCLTGDSLLKILAIVCRVRCKVPGKCLHACTDVVSLSINVRANYHYRLDFWQWCYWVNVAAAK